LYLALVYWIFFPFCIVLVVYLHSFHSTLTTPNIHNILLTLVATHACLYHVSLYAHTNPFPYPPFPIPHTNANLDWTGLDWPAITAHTARIFPGLLRMVGPDPTYSDLRYLMLNDSACTHLLVHVTLEFDELFNATDSD